MLGVRHVMIDLEFTHCRMSACTRRIAAVLVSTKA
jgi:hypothetical protein